MTSSRLSVCRQNFWKTFFLFNLAVFVKSNHIEDRTYLFFLFITYSILRYYLLQVGLEVLGLLVEVLDVLETVPGLPAEPREDHRLLTELQQPDNHGLLVNKQ